MIGYDRRVVVRYTLECGGTVIPAADVEYIAVLFVLHPEVDEETLGPGGLTGFERDGTVTERFRRIPQVAAHHVGTAPLQRTIRGGPGARLRFPALRHVGFDGPSVGKGDFQVSVFVVRVPAAQRNPSSDLDGYRGLPEHVFYIVGRTVMGEQLLHVIRRTSGYAVCIQLNQRR